VRSAITALDAAMPATARRVDSVFLILRNSCFKTVVGFWSLVVSRWSLVFSLWSLVFGLTNDYRPMTNDFNFNSVPIKKRGRSLVFIGIKLSSA